ncbi:hypothetical protein [uncultured Dysosmobacter sp.]|uniref:hypothetical protein n=1 Tax=uncultured Dysosmobacter sp. TaxID=2591384 RepID=UPI0026338EFF|nr:hypothetical protein [uncultured Dysosmobacter sp.]
MSKSYESFYRPVRQDVLRSSRACSLKGYDFPRGFPPTSGCRLPIGTPAANMQALMDAVRICGRYPVEKRLPGHGDEL